MLAVPVDKSKKKAIREQLRMKEKSIVLAVGQFIPRKGFDVLMKATIGMEDVGVYIIGGEAIGKYLLLREELKAENVHFVPF